MMDEQTGASILCVNGGGRVSTEARKVRLDKEKAVRYRYREKEKEKKRKSLHSKHDSTDRASRFTTLMTNGTQLVAFEYYTHHLIPLAFHRLSLRS
jgi:hypothetical protein